jgi:hypothetical protein
MSAYALFGRLGMQSLQPPDEVHRDPSKLILVVSPHLTEHPGNTWGNKPIAPERQFERFKTFMETFTQYDDEQSTVTTVEIRFPDEYANDGQAEPCMTRPQMTFTMDFKKGGKSTFAMCFRECGKSTPTKDRVSMLKTFYHKHDGYRERGDVKKFVKWYHEVGKNSVNKWDPNNEDPNNKDPTNSATVLVVAHSKVLWAAIKSLPKSSSKSASEPPAEGSWCMNERPAQNAWSLSITASLENGEYKLVPRVDTPCVQGISKVSNELCRTGPHCSLL